MGLALLFVVSAVVAPSSIHIEAILLMLPFACILGIAALGQQLVIQHRGLDLSVGGAISLVCVLCTHGIATDASPSDIVIRLIFVVLAAAAVGFVNGVLIVKFKLQSLVTTIGVNGVLMGFVLWISNGTPGNAPQLLGQFSLGRSAGMPNTLLIAAVVIAIASVVLERTKVGRRFVLASTNGPAAEAVGLRTARIEIGAYTLAGICYGVGGMLLAGLLSVPSLTVGQIYLLTSVAAVVLGGNSLTGGRASAVSTLVGALFMTQLGQMLVAAGFDRSVQNVMQGIIVVAGASIHAIVPRILSSRSSMPAK